MRPWKFAVGAFCAIGLVIALCLFGITTKASSTDHFSYSVDNGLVTVIRITVDQPAMEVIRSQVPDTVFREVAQYKFSKHNAAADRAMVVSKRLNTGVVRSQAPIVWTNCDEQRMNHVATIKRWANEIELDGI